MSQFKDGDISSLLRIQKGPGVNSASCKMSTGTGRLTRAFEVVEMAECRTLTTLPLLNAMAVNMCTFKTTTSVGIHDL